jgi:hypothetical protein
LLDSRAAHLRAAPSAPSARGAQAGPDRPRPDDRPRRSSQYCRGLIWRAARHWWTPCRTGTPTARHGPRHHVEEIPRASPTACCCATAGSAVHRRHPHRRQSQHHVRHALSVSHDGVRWNARPYVNEWSNGSHQPLGSWGSSRYAGRGHSLTWTSLSDARRVSQAASRPSCSWPHLAAVVVALISRPHLFVPARLCSRGPPGPRYRSSLTLGASGRATARSPLAGGQVEGQVEALRPVGDHRGRQEVRCSSTASRSSSIRRRQLKPGNLGEPMPDIALVLSHSSSSST